MTAPQYGYQPYYEPPEGIAITTKYSVVFATLLAASTPKIVVNGYEMPARGWGRTVFPLAPGQYHLHVHTPYFFPRQVGPADHTVAVHPGQVVELEYRAPLFTFVRGALGPPPQPYRGVIALSAVLAVPVVLILVLLLLG
jgi:hypothetical protein